MAWYIYELTSRLLCCASRPFRYDWATVYWEDDGFVEARVLAIIREGGEGGSDGARVWVCIQSLTNSSNSKKRVSGVPGMYRDTLQQSSGSHRTLFVVRARSLSYAALVVPDVSKSGAITHWVVIPTRAQWERGWSRTAAW